MNILKDSFKLTFAKGLTILLNTVVIMILARLISVEDYGTYSQLILISTLATTIFSLGLPNCLNFFLSIAPTEKEKGEFLSTFYTMNTLIGIITGIVLYFSLPILSNILKNPDLESYGFFLLLFPLSKIVSSSVENLLVNYRKTNLLIGSKVLYVFIMLVSVALVFFAKLSFKHYILLFLSCEVIMAIITYSLSYYISHKRLKIKISFQLLLKIFKFSIPLGISAMIGTLSIELDKLCINLFYSKEQFAIYTNASRELPFSVITLSISAVTMPIMIKYLRRNMKDSAIDLWKKSNELTFFVFTLIAFVLIANSKEFMTFLYSEKYLSGQFIFQIYCFTIIIRSTNFSQLLSCKGETKFILISSGLSLIINIILNIILLNTIGFNGPAIATVVSMLSMGLFQLFITSKRFSCSLKDIYPWKSIFHILIFNIILFIIFTAIIQYFITSLILKLFIDLIWILFAIFLYKNKLLEIVKFINKKDVEGYV